MKTICVCGGGALGHVISGWLSSLGVAKVNILTSQPERWSEKITIDTPDGEKLMGNLNLISKYPSEVISHADVVLFCYPGYLIRTELTRIKPYLNPNTFIGCVFSSTGFFFEALEILNEKQPLWGFQRVPFIARVNEYGKSGHLLGYKKTHSIAVEHVSEEEKNRFCEMISVWFGRPVKLLNNYYEASLTNSNPLLHTSRLYTMFGGANEGKKYSRNVLFYEEWTEEAASLLIDMDAELFSLIKKLPVAPDFLQPILTYYESWDVKSLTAKISSIEGFKGIYSPMKETEDGWVADYESRYFTEDFPFGLKYIWKLAHQYGIDCQTIDKVFSWGIEKCLNK